VHRFHEHPQYIGEDGNLLTDADGIGVQLKRLGSIDLESLFALVEDCFSVDARLSVSVRREDAQRDMPDGLVLSVCHIARDEVSILAKMNAAVDLLDSDDWEPNLKPVRMAIRPYGMSELTFNVQFSMMLAISRPVASPIPSHRSRVTLLPKRRFLR
jgi:hypothetical protein